MKKLTVLIIVVLALGINLNINNVSAATKAVDDSDVTFTIHVTDKVGAPTAPDTGASSEITSLITENPIIMSLVILLGTTTLVLIIRKIIFRKQGGDYFDDSGLKIKKNASRVTFFGILGLFAITGGLLANNYLNREAEAADTDSYPYKISSKTDSNWDIYVRPGGTAKESFVIKTTTDNETGFSLFIDADQSELTYNDRKIGSIMSDAVAADLLNNTYGFSIDEESYHRMPNTGEESALINETTTPVANGYSTDISFFVKVAEDLPIGDYTTTLHIKSETNPVTRKISFANGNLAIATRLSDNQTLAEGDDILLGEDIRLSVSADVSGIVQTITANGAIVNNGATVTVADNMAVATIDDSIHFLKNTITFYDGLNYTGSNGDAILIKSQGKYWLVDAGWSRNKKYRDTNGVIHDNAYRDSVNGEKVAIYLEKLGIQTLDYILLTHIHADHVGGLEQIKQNITLDNGTVINKKIDSNTTVFLRGCNATIYSGECSTTVNDLVNNNGATVVQLSRDEETRRNLHDNGMDFGNFHVDFYNIDTDANGNIEYYGPKNDGADERRENLNSIGIKLTHKISGKTIFLGGDMEVPNELIYGPEIGKVDILKSGHHGNYSSSPYEFFNILQPDVVINTKPDMARNDGTAWNQIAAWAYTEQRGGEVYFTGQATKEAITIRFTDSSYEVKNAVAKNVTMDANTLDNPVSYDGGATYFRWGGGLCPWIYPAEGDGSYAPYQHKYYVYVYQVPQNGNIIAINENKCIDGKLYRFGSDGVAPAPTSSDTCSD